MRKENILLVILVLLAGSGIYYYNQPASDLGVQVANAETEPLSAANQTSQVSASATLKQILWNGYTPGMALAEKEGKSIFLYFHASWCGYCGKLKKETFTDDRVKAYLNDHFVSISVDTEKQGELAGQWGVRGLPNMWFLESDGAKISNLPGFVDADQLLPILQYIHTQSYKTMNFKEYVQQKKS